MRIMFGGSFNPPTIAHQQIIKHLSSMDDATVIIVPNGEQYELKTLVSYVHRKRMLELLIHDSTNVTISDIERDRPFQGTVATLRQLDHPYLAMGSDCLLGLSQWKQAEILLKENQFLVYCRKQTVLEVESFIQTNPFLKSFAKHFHLFAFVLSDVSSTDFRKTKGREIVPFEVFQYIQQNHLYEV